MADPDKAVTWIDLGKNVLMILVGVFIILHETVGVDPPSVVLLAVAAALLGLPILDYLLGVRRNGKNGDGKTAS